MQWSCSSLPVDSGCRKRGSGKKPIIPVQSHKGKAMAHSSLCYLAKGLVLPVFSNFILTAADSQHKPVSTHFRLRTNTGHQPCTHRPQQTEGRAELFLAPSLAPSFLICTAGSCAGLRQLSGSSWLPGHTG